MLAKLLYLLTGHVSHGAVINAEFAEMLRWGAASADREIVMLVGIWKSNYGEVRDSIAELVAGAIKSLANQGGNYEVNITFRAADQWHVKAIGLTGIGTKFRDATHAIFGSTNFAWSARHGDNYELDLYLDCHTPSGADLLREYAIAISNLIKEATVRSRYIHFDEDVKTEVLAKYENVRLISSGEI